MEEPKIITEARNFEALSSNKSTLDSSEAESEKSLAQTLMAYLEADGCTLFVDQHQTPCYATLLKPALAQKINSKSCQLHLIHKHWESTGQALTIDATKPAISTLEARAAHSGVVEYVNVRVGRMEDIIYYDLCSDNQIVRIDKDGWELQSEAPIYFRRYSHQETQITPLKGGNLRNILKYFNIKEENQQLLALVHIVVSFIPDIPRAIVAISGDQGSGKSMFLKFLRSLIDPSRVSLMAPLDSLKELVQAASHHYAIYFDNLSHLSPWLSDALCRIATGEGFQKRELYTNDEDILYSFRSSVGLCGINQVAQRADLLDRSIIIHLERIADSERREERQIWQQFNEEKPLLFGALLDAVSACLRIAPTLDIKSAPRMADYYRYAFAAALHLGYTESQILEAFQLNNKYQNQEAIEASGVAQVIVELVNSLGNIEWEGTSSELFDVLHPLAIKLKLTSGFPKAANWLWRRIMEVKTNLSSSGINIEKRESANGTIIRIYKDTSNTAITATQPKIEAEAELTKYGSSGNNGNSQINEQTINDIFFGDTPTHK